MGRWVDKIASVDSNTFDIVTADDLSRSGRLLYMSKSCIAASWFEGTWSFMMSVLSQSDIFVEDFLGRAC